MMYDGLGKALDTLFIMFFACFPFAIWKVIDIIIWLYQNIEIGLK